MYKGLDRCTSINDCAIRLLFVSNDSRFRLEAIKRNCNFDDYIDFYNESIANEATID